MAIVKDGVARASRQRHGDAHRESRRAEPPLPQVTVVDHEHASSRQFSQSSRIGAGQVGLQLGACHGAAAGKNGFKLSLRGYDAEADYFTITRQARGRRIVPNDPARSLVLLKPTGALPHKGGVRFEVDSPDYRLMLDWIAAGTPPPKPDDPRLDRLEILPERAPLKPGDSAATARAGSLFRRPRRRRYPLGEIHFVRRIGRPGRCRGACESHRLGRRRRQRLVRQPDHGRHDQRSVPETALGRCFRHSAAAEFHRRTVAWRNCSG